MVGRWWWWAGDAAVSHLDARGGKVVGGGR
jgi:hypothetical protein